MYKIQKDFIGETEGIEIDIMEKSNKTKFVPSYKSIEIQ
jgi:hypothetical protein